MPETRDIIAFSNFSLKAIQTERALEIFPLSVLSIRTQAKSVEGKTKPVSKGMINSLFIALAQEAELARDTGQSTMKTRPTRT